MEIGKKIVNVSDVAQVLADQSLAKERVASEDYFADFDFESLEADMGEMLKSGVHFGHQKSRRNPKMDEYIFGVKNNISIIDLQKTVEKLEEASNFISEVISAGKSILFVGTKKQVKRLVESAARRSKMPYVVERWLGGTFTNFKIISIRTRFLREEQEKMKRGGYAKYTKFEQLKKSQELDRMEERMGGIKHMLKLPGAIIVTGVIEDHLAIKEAVKEGVPIIALADTNVDPSKIDYPVPANDDAISSLRLMLAYLTKVIIKNKPESIIK